MYVAFKETNETEYWLELLFESIQSDNNELLKLLASITKSMMKK